ncbi:MAG: amidohydrolase family protein [Myxococcota bacterium]
MGCVDYWCNAFTPDRRALWDAAVEEQGLSVKVRRDATDSFTDAATMVARMDELDLDVLLLPTADVPEDAGPHAYERYASSWSELMALCESHPRRFRGLWSFDPTGVGGLQRAAEALAHPACVGLHLHTHSFDRAFDHRELYPFYALAAERDVPVVMQAGASGGRLPSECGRPIGIDRPALYFGAVRFVLSHTGWPWTDEALAMVQKHANVFLGTAAFPANHWSPALAAFVRGAGRGKVLFGTSFPVVGHRHGLSRLEALDLPDDAREALLGGAARRVFKEL